MVAAVVGKLWIGPKLLALSFDVTGDGRVGRICEFDEDYTFMTVVGVEGWISSCSEGGIGAGGGIGDVCRRC